MIEKKLIIVKPARFIGMSKVKADIWKKIKQESHSIKQTEVVLEEEKIRKQMQRANKYTLPSETFIQPYSDYRNLQPPRVEL